MPHVTFIHGIANKPEEKILLKIWQEALAQDKLGNGDQIDLGAEGVTTSMIYWADVLYGKPNEIIEESVSGFENVEEIAEKVIADPDMSWRSEIYGQEKELIDSLASKLLLEGVEEGEKDGELIEEISALERVPLPWFIKRRVMKWLLKDVHHYLFNFQFSPREGVSFSVQDEIRRRVVDKLNEVDTDTHIVIAHSMGTVIIYDCLKRVADCPSIDGLMTVGSPLGIDEIQDKFSPEWTRSNGFPEKLKGKWINIYDRLDPVAAFDGNIANDYKQNNMEVIEMINEQNFGSWRHNITNYLSMPLLRASLLRLLNF